MKSLLQTTAQSLVEPKEEEVQVHVYLMVVAMEGSYHFHLYKAVIKGKKHYHPN